MEIFGPADPRILVKKKELKSFGPLTKFCDRVMLFWPQTLDDGVEIGDLCEQKPHIGQVASACNEAEDVLSVSWIKDLVRFVALDLQPPLNAKNCAHLPYKVVFMWLEGFP